MEQDRILGAAEIEEKVMNYILKQDDIFSAALHILEAYPSMGSVWNIVNNIFLYGGDKKEMISRQESIEKLVENASSLISDGATIATYSRSSTVVRILKRWAEREIRTICSEGRPMMEGRKLAGELGSMVDLTLLIDAALLSMIEEVDAILIGADAITEGGIVNKVGTYALSVVAKEKNVPIWVASTLSKTFPFVFIKEESGKEIWKDFPSSIRIKNVYFDFTPSDMISLFITEEGVSRKKPEFKGKISKEVKEIAKMMEKKYHLVR